MRRLFAGLAAAVVALSALPAAATVFVVGALPNSSTGGVGLNTGIVLTAGQSISVTSSTDDLWSSGPRPRFSDGNGVVERYATASDDSGIEVGVQIGANFPMWTQNGLTARYGSLVGEIGGTYFFLGANNTVAAPLAGVLNLYYWDENAADNFGSIAFDITTDTGAVPEPATWAMMLMGFGAVGAAMRRRPGRALAAA